MIPDEERCKEYVYRADVMRRTGQGPTGWSLHYNRGRCRRRAGASGYCYQHPWGEKRADNARKKL